MLERIRTTLRDRARLQPALSRVRSAIATLSSADCFEKNAERTSRFLFVVGCGRSGNTLLRRLMIESFDIYVPPETYVLPNQIRDYCSGRKRSWPERVDALAAALENHATFADFRVADLDEFRAEAKAWPESAQSFADLITGLYAWIGKRQGIDASWVGDKTPAYTMELGLLHWAFPRAKFVYLERDPVDVVQSYLEAGLYGTADEAAMRWRRSLGCWQDFRRLKPAGEILELRYEDLVRDPEGQLDVLAERFGLPRRSDRLALDLDRLGDVAAHDHHANAVRPVTTSSIGKGRARISEDDLRIVRRMLSDLPARRNYANP